MARAFDDLSEVYEGLVDWTKRLSHESPFYQRLLGAGTGKSLLDAACGPGYHAAMFHEWGFEVEGADISSSMIERARARFGEPDGLAWRRRAFQEPPSQEGRFDAALCVGNSLSLAPDTKTVHLAVKNMLSAVRSGGVVVLQTLNLLRLTDGPCLWQKSLPMRLSSGDVLVLKGVHRSGVNGFVNVVVLSPVEGVLLHSESVPLLGLDFRQLVTVARQCGATRVDVWGDYEGSPFEPATSLDLILVINK